MARPSSFTSKIGAEICRRMICGDDGEPESLRSICRDDSMPHIATVMRWLENDAGFREQYARAREAQAEIQHEQMLEIADNCTDDVIFLVDEDGHGEGAKPAIKHSAIARAKLQIDTRKWIMGRMAPKKYGDTINQNIKADVQVADASTAKSKLMGGIVPLPAPGGAEEEG